MICSWAVIDLTIKFLSNCIHILMNKICCKLLVRAPFLNVKEFWIMIQNPWKTPDCHQNVASFNLGYFSVCPENLFKSLLVILTITNGGTDPVLQNILVWLKVIILVKAVLYACVGLTGGRVSWEHCTSSYCLLLPGCLQAFAAVAPSVLLQRSLSWT